MNEPERKSIERRRVIFHGHVQGVGFRYTVRQVAGDFDVTGFVRNLPDGSVEAIVEGERSEIDGMMREIQQRMSQFIHRVDQSSQPAANEFADFGIRP